MYTDETFLTFRTSTEMSASPWQVTPTLFEIPPSSSSHSLESYAILILNIPNSNFHVLSVVSLLTLNQLQFPLTTPSNKVRQGVPGNRNPPVHICMCTVPPGSDVGPVSLHLLQRLGPSHQPPRHHSISATFVNK